MVIFTNRSLKSKSMAFGLEDYLMYMYIYVYVYRQDGHRIKYQQDRTKLISILGEILTSDHYLEKSKERRHGIRRMRGEKKGEVSAKRK